MCRLQDCREGGIFEVLENPAGLVIMKADKTGVQHGVS
jgi:hypothetical protein